jgi:toxin-antitoxin system PIN domain toxin
MTMSEPANSWRVAEASAGWRPASGDLPDVNVWLALTHTGHPFHEPAARYWQTACDAGTSLWFCRTTMMSLVRLLAQSAVMGEQVMSLPQALAVYQQWQAVPQVGMLPDPPELDALLQTMVGSLSVPLPARLWPDACLAATAQATGLKMVTFDRDFARFNLSDWELLRWNE